MAWIEAAPWARPSHAERRDERRELASEAVDERFWNRWAMVRSRGRMAGVRKTRKSRDGNVRYGLRPLEDSVIDAGAGVFAGIGAGKGVRGVAGRVEDE